MKWGEFSIESLPAGTFYLSYSASGYIDFSEEITVAADQTADASHALIAKNATVSGHVQLADGTVAQARSERSFVMVTSGWISFVMQEPLSGEKMWIKKLELDPIARGLHSPASLRRERR